MSLTFQIESIAQVWNELMVLVSQHWAGTKSYRRHEPLNPSYERYKACNESGFLVFFTARDGETLAGYFILYLTTSMHSQLPMAVEDTFFLSPQYRGGTTAYRFLKVVKEQCRAWGVHEILFSCEIENATGIQGLLDKLDFTPVIVQHSCILDPIPGSDTALASHQETRSVETVTPSA